MDTCSAIHKKVRAGLRSRRVHVDVHAPFGDTTKNEPESIKPKTKKAKLDRLVETTRLDLDVSYVAKASKIGKSIVGKSKRNVLPRAANEVDGGSSKTVLSENEVELSGRTEDVMYENRSEIAYSANDLLNANDNDANIASSTDDNHVNLNDSRSKTSSIGEIQEYQDDAKDSESDDLQDNCLEDVLKEVNKDIGALYSKTNKIEADLKEIKQILLTRPSSQHCIRTISSHFKQKTSFQLLPTLPLQKKSAVSKMDSNADDEDNEEYKDQLVMKLASFGGDTVNEVVINIFKKLFSTKLKTKYCWKGTAKGKRAFKRLTGIREAIWSAVKIHFKDCTESTVNKEIKLRLNQAQKDYDRELLKNRNGVEY